MDKLNMIADYLLEHEKIDGSDFRKLMKGELDLAAKAAEKAADDSAKENLKSCSERDAEE
jgi:hypothetical protein